VNEAQTTATPTTRHDRKRGEAIKYGRLFVQRRGGSFTTEDWKAYRQKLVKEKGIELASVATIYRWFKDEPHPWLAFLEACHLNEQNPERTNKCGERELLRHLQTAAQVNQDQTGNKVLSTHSYDRVRAANPDLRLRSSSAIRKHLGPWPVACARAGVQSPDQRGPRRFTPAECIATVQRAKADAIGELTMQGYATFVSGLAELGEVLPELAQLIDEFGSWEAALRFADVEQSNVIHPETLWEASEAREIAAQARIVLPRHYGREFDKEGYEFLCTQIGRPLPDWETLTWLLAQ
jgi:hypothetical protein